MQKAVRASLQLLGNASAHFNVERQKEVMKHLNNDIKFLAETEFPQSGPYLFGDDFETKAKTAADNIRALEGIQSNKNRFFGTGGPNKKAKSTSQGHRTNWGVFPHFTNQSSTDWESHNLTDNRDRSSSTKQQTRRQSSEAILDRGSDPTSTPGCCMECQPTPWVGDAPPKDNSLSGRENTGTYRELEITDIGLRNFRSSHWSQVGPYRDPKAVPHTFVKGKRQRDKANESRDTEAPRQRGNPAGLRNFRGYYSRIFLVPKKGGQYRPVINLRPLNSWIHYHNFKMEGIHVVRDLLLKGDYFTRIDLKDTYLTIPMHQNSRGFSAFAG